MDGRSDGRLTFPHGNERFLADAEGMMATFDNGRFAGAVRGSPTLGMASIIRASRRPLADVRGITADLERVGFRNDEVRRFVDEAIARARPVGGFPSW